MRQTRRTGSAGLSNVKCVVYGTMRRGMETQKGQRKGGEAQL